MIERLNWARSELKTKIALKLRPEHDSAPLVLLFRSAE